MREVGISILVALLTVGPALVFAAPEKTPSPSRDQALAITAVAAQEKAGKLKTMTQIQALMKANKTQEALQAFLDRAEVEGKIKKGKDK